MDHLPDYYEALMRLDDHGNDRSVETLQMPDSVPKGKILIKMFFAPINPSDWMFFLNNSYGQKEKMPKGQVIGGFEGSGIVVRIGSGVAPSLLKRKVSVCADPTSPSFEGTWGEYMTVDLNRVIVFPDTADLEKIHSCMINPGTVFSMAELLKQKSDYTAVFNAAGSSLCRMAARYFNEVGLKTIMIVRRQQHVAELLKDGADIVLDSSAVSYEADLTDAIEYLQPKNMFDAVGGSNGVNILNQMPVKSTLYSYGALSRKPLDGLNPMELIFKQKSVQ